MRRLLGWLLAATLVGGVGAVAFAEPEEPINAAVQPVADPDDETTAEPTDDSPRADSQSEPDVEQSGRARVHHRPEGRRLLGRSDGLECRVGQVNTPEYNEPCGPEATEFTRDFLAAGFTADD